MATAFADTKAPQVKAGIGSRPWFVVAVLSLAAIVAYIDRQIITLLVEPIKADLGASEREAFCGACTFFSGSAYDPDAGTDQ